jgi:hypothetical protein
MSMMLMVLAAGGASGIDPFDAEFVLIAGGGSFGGGNGAGGGGAGGFITSVSGETGPGGNSSLSPVNLSGATNFSVTIGAAGSDSTFSGTDSSNSAFSYTAVAGGDGGSGGSGSAGQSGGSGGGGAYVSGSYGAADTTFSPLQGSSGLSAQSTIPNYCSNAWAQGLIQCEGFGGGGGGAGANGLTDAGGDGLQSSITGTATYYAGGGAPSNKNGSLGTPGNGASNYGGGTGQSGVLILRYTSDATISNPGGGLTMSTTTVGSNYVTTITAGTGSIRFN